MFFIQVIAAAGSDEKCKLAMQRGAQFSVNYSRGSLKEAVKQLVGSDGVNVVIDMVGGDICLEALRRCVQQAVRGGLALGLCPTFLHLCLPPGLAFLSSLLFTSPVSISTNENS